MSNGFAGLGGVGAVQLPINNGRDQDVDGDVSVRQCWSSCDSWTEVILDFAGERRFVVLTYEQATVLAGLLCESTHIGCDGCDDGVGPVVTTPDHSHVAQPTTRKASK